MIKKILPLLMSTICISLLPSCVFVPIPHHVNSIKMQGRLINEKDESPVDDAFIILNYDKNNKLIRSNKNGKFSTRFGGNWRYGYLYIIAPSDRFHFQANEKPLELAIYHSDYEFKKMDLVYYADPVERMSSSSVQHFDSGRTEVMDIGIIKLKQECVVDEPIQK